MKTTIEVSDALFDDLKRTAAEHHRTMRSLVEEGLRLVLDEYRGRGRSRGLRDARYGAGGMTPKFEGQGWDAVRDAIYQGRGA